MYFILITIKKVNKKMSNNVTRPHKIYNEILKKIKHSETKVKIKFKKKSRN